MDFVALKVLLTSFGRVFGGERLGHFKTVSMSQLAR